MLSMKNRRTPFAPLSHVAPVYPTLSLSLILVKSKLKTKFSASW